ncbi:MAG: hypothetical protein IJX86_03300 [Lachnospiraceae bacterium]|nr:hypothetical protein [Lachnospiraceae bacterium]
MKNKIKLIIPVAVATLIATISLWIVYKETGKISEEWWKLGITALCTAPATLYVVYNKVTKRQLVFGCVGGALYGFMYIYGAYVHNLLETARSIGELMKLFALAIGYSVFPMMLFTTIIMILPKLRERLNMGMSTDNCYPQISRKKAVLTCLMYIGIIFLFWVPVFLAYYPTLLQYDGAYQLQDVIKEVHSIWHPLAHTLLMGVFYNFGVSVGSAAFGMAFYSILQMLVLAGFMGYTVFVLYRSGAPKWLRIIVLLVYSLFPVNSIFAITTTKDVLFAAFFLGFIILLVSGIVNKNSYTWVQVVVMMVVGGAMLLYRNNAIYAFAVAAPFMIWNMKGARVKLLCAILGSVILYTSVNEALISVAKAPESKNVTEKMSVPLMQLAYVVSDPSNELDPQTRAEVLTYINESSLSGYYLVIADQIKGNANNDLLRENMTNFFKMWGKIGLKYPMQYLDAWGILTMGYWYMDDIYNTMIYGRFMMLGHKQIGMGEEIEKTCYLPVVQKMMDKLFGNNQYQKIPIISTLCTPAFYFWILIGYLLIVWYEKRRGLAAPGILCLAYYATLFLGPVALIRYMYCIMVVTPVLLFLLLCKKDGENNADTKVVTL